MWDEDKGFRHDTKERVKYEGGLTGIREKWEERRKDGEGETRGQARREIEGMKENWESRVQIEKGNNRYRKIENWEKTDIKTDRLINTYRKEKN